MGKIKGGIFKFTYFISIPSLLSSIKKSVGKNTNGLFNFISLSVNLHLRTLSSREKLQLIVIY